ncbi:hypothetical protein J7J58_05415 [candidate division WOR-3 bacterium]|nr:hypothetical protein [candidate division WOR-3 bacterium]
MKKFLSLILAFPFVIYANSPVINGYKVKPSVSYSFVSTGSGNYFLQQYTLNLVNRHNNRLKTDMKISYLQINKNSFIAPELKMTYKLNKSTKLFLNVRVIKPIASDSNLFSPYRNFNNIGQWK